MRRPVLIAISLSCFTLAAMHCQPMRERRRYSAAAEPAPEIVLPPPTAATSAEAMFDLYEAGVVTRAEVLEALREGG